MTERGVRHVMRRAATLAIGPSRLEWDGAALVAEIDEVAVPIPHRVRGRIVLRPDAIHGTCFDLDANGRHRWYPWAPSARVEVVFSEPRIAWTGRGYADANAGAVPLVDDFRRWDWSRAHDGERTLMLYHAEPRRGRATQLSLAADAAGIHALAPPPRHGLRPSVWRLRREVGSETMPSLVRTLEDAPFYARGLVRARIDGQDLLGMHETLDLDRLRRPIVQAMLPFRMPRRG